MKRLIKILSIAILCLTIQLSTPSVVEAQCPMCRMSAEQNLKNGGTAGKGLNAGIIYLLMTPYFVIGCIGFVWWRNKKEEADIAFDER